MKLRYYGLSLLLLTSVLHAESIIQPTPAAKPLPTIKETQNPDTVLREVVQKRLRQEKRLMHKPISAASFNRIIRLEGSVDTHEQEDIAIAIAQSVPGVRGVISQLTIRYDSPEYKKAQHRK